MDSTSDDRRAEETTLLGRVTGRVQGVGFRWFVREAAARHGIRGDVRNLADGRVEFRCRGTQGAVDGFLEEVRRGPRGSRVDRLVTERLGGEADIDDRDGFAIVR